MNRTGFSSLAPALVAVLFAGVLSNPALAGEPEPPVIEVAGCLDPTEAGADAYDVLDINVGEDSCPKACKDGAKACLGAGKAQLSCVSKVVKPIVKAAVRGCGDDPETEDDCLGELEAEIGPLLEDVKTEKGQLKENCAGTFGQCLAACAGKL